VSVEDALFHFLTTDATNVKAITSTRVYPAGDVPESVKPSDRFLTYQRISDLQAQYQAGSAGLRSARFQFNCVGATRQQARQLAEALLTDLNFQRGQIGATGNKTTLRGTHYEESFDEFERPSDASARGPHAAQVDVMIHYVE